MNKEKTGLLIKNARLEKGFTQSELSDILGVSNKAVSRWECGETFPDVGLLDHLANTLDLTIEELVIGERNAAADDSPSEPANIQTETSRPNTYRELVQAVRLQRKERIRNFSGTFVGVFLGSIVLAEGLLAFLGRLPAQSLITYGISLAIVLFGIGGLSIRTGLLVPSKKEKVAFGFSVGSFFHKQLRSGSAFPPAMLCSVSVLFLLLLYQSILGTLQSADSALQSLLLSTGIVLAITILTNLFFSVYKKLLINSIPTDQ